jgi:hypothetical protein
MSWTMPPRVLQIVAAMIVLAAITAFALGVMNAPERGRLPGEKPGAPQPAAAAIDATDATPLVNERIEGPPPPTPEELAAKAKAEAEAKAKAEAEAAEREAAALAAAGNAPVLTLPPAAGNTAPPPAQTLGGPPAPDEPPH